MDKYLKTLESSIKNYRKNSNKESFDQLKGSVKKFYDRDYIYVKKIKRIKKECEYEKCNNKIDKKDCVLYKCLGGDGCERISYYCSKKCLDCTKNVDAPCTFCRREWMGCYGTLYSD